MGVEGAEGRKTEEGEQTIAENGRGFSRRSLVLVIVLFLVLSGISFGRENENE